MGWGGWIWMGVCHDKDRTGQDWTVLARIGDPSSPRLSRSPAPQARSPRDKDRRLEQLAYYVGGRGRHTGAWCGNQGGRGNKECGIISWPVCGWCPGCWGPGTRVSVCPPHPRGPASLACMQVRPLGALPVVGWVCGACRPILNQENFPGSTSSNSVTVRWEASRYRGRWLFMCVRLRLCGYMYMCCVCMCICMCMCMCVLGAECVGWMPNLLLCPSRHFAASQGWISVCCGHCSCVDLLQSRRPGPPLPFVSISSEIDEVLWRLSNSPRRSRLVGRYC